MPGTPGGLEAAAPSLALTPARPPACARSTWGLHNCDVNVLITASNICHGERAAYLHSIIHVYLLQRAREVHTLC